MNVKQNYYFYNIHYVAILAGIKPHQSKELVTTQYNSVPRAGVNSLRDPVVYPKYYVDRYLVCRSTRTTGSTWYEYAYKDRVHTPVLPGVIY